MPANHNQRSATIYQFPAGGRAGLDVQQARGFPETASEATPHVGTSYGEAWYHQEAIMGERDKRTRN